MERETSGQRPRPNYRHPQPRLEAGSGERVGAVMVNDVPCWGAGGCW